MNHINREHNVKTHESGYTCNFHSTVWWIVVCTERCSNYLSSLFNYWYADFMNVAGTHLQSLHSSSQTSYQIYGMMMCLENQMSHETSVVSLYVHHVMETRSTPQNLETIKIWAPISHTLWDSSWTLSIVRIKIIKMYDFWRLVLSPSSGKEFYSIGPFREYFLMKISFVWWDQQSRTSLPCLKTEAELACKILHF